MTTCLAQCRGSAEGRHRPLVSGVIMRSSWQVADLLAAGRLELLLQDVPTPSADVYALHADSHHVPARCRFRRGDT